MVVFISFIMIELYHKTTQISSINAGLWQYFFYKKLVAFTLCVLLVALWNTKRRPLWYPNSKIASIWHIAISCLPHEYASICEQTILSSKISHNMLVLAVTAHPPLPMHQNKNEILMCSIANEEPSIADIMQSLKSVKSSTSVILLAVFLKNWIIG